MRDTCPPRHSRARCALRRSATALLAGAALWATVSDAREFVCTGGSDPAPGAARPAAGQGQPVPTRGRVRVLVVCARFQDESPRPPPAWAPHLFDSDRGGSLAHFYRTMSFGQLTVDGVVLPERYSADGPASDYAAAKVGDMGDFGRFAAEVLAGVDRDVDFRRFDSDGPDGQPDSGDDDGFVDYLFLNLQSMPRNFLRGGATGIGGLGHDYVTGDLGRDGNPLRVRGGIGFGAIQLEGDFAQTAGVMAHEFGHGLGLPDLYDPSFGDPAGDSAGIGRWDLMAWGALGWNGDDGPNPLSAWSLEQLGWVGAQDGRLVDVEADVAQLRIQDLRAGGPVLRIRLQQGAAPAAAQEYLLLEHRTRAGSDYDRDLPGEGLLVWCVRPLARGNDDEHGKRVDLVCADGLYRDSGFPHGQRPDGVRGGDNLDFWSHDEAYTTAHGGNWGDATDPFDGVRFTRFHMDGNPSSRPRGPLPSAFAGLDLSVRRDGQDLIVDIAQPRWAGSIGEEVHWSGLVRVDGDLHVAPEGRLFIEAGTRVLFAGRDRLRGGVDPDRCELRVEGDLVVEPVTGEARTVFAADRPGDRWYGILLEPAPDSRVELPEGDYELRDAAHGISLPGAPSPTGQTLTRFHMIDASGLRTAGNGDGQLSPGETFQIAVDVANWSLRTCDGVQGELRWLTSRVTPVEADSPLQREIRLDLASLSPGAQRTLTWPSLSLSPDAVAGEEVRFDIRVLGLDGGERRQTLSFVVQGRYPAHTSRIAVPGRVIRQGVVVVPAGRASPIRARVEGDVEAVELVAQPAGAGGAGREIVMVRSEPTVFDALFEPPAVGAFHLFLRVRDPHGSVAFSQSRLELWALPGHDPLPALVFLGAPYRRGKIDVLEEAFARALRAVGMEMHTILINDDDISAYRALLAHYADQGGLVAWLAEIQAEGDQASLASFLQGGGHLLLASSTVAPTGSTRSFLERMLFTGLGGHTESRSRVRALAPLEAGSFQVQHSWLTVTPPAEPLLVDEFERAAGLRLDTGGYRAVFLPFDLNSLSQSELRGLLEPGVRFLQQPRATAVDDAAQPAAYRLGDSYPNPFNAAATLPYQLPRQGPVRLTLFNLAGQPVRRLVDEVQRPGLHRARWDGTDESGLPVASGIYFFRLEAGAQQRTRQLVLLR